MCALRLYYDLISQPSRAVFIFLKITGIPFESHPVALRQGEHFCDNFTNINPFQKVPVIVDGDFKLTESVAILRYLARSRTVDDHWYPYDVQLQAKVDEYLEWQHLNVRANCARYFQIQFLQPNITGIPAKPERVLDFQKRMEESLGDLEKIWLQNGRKKYLTGNKISIADILGACEVEQPKMAGYDVALKHPILSEWLGSVGRELSPYYDESHTTVNNIAKTFGGAPAAKAKM